MPGSAAADCSDPVTAVLTRVTGKAVAGPLQSAGGCAIILADKTTSQDSLWEWAARPTLFVFAARFGAQDGRLPRMRDNRHPVVRRIEAEVEQLLNDFGYELVQIKYGGEGGGRALTVLMDKEGGVTAEDCSEMSRRLSMLLDTLDPIPKSYTLIVSSPGLDRPLTRDGDFDRFAGERAAVRHRVEGARRTDQGTLLGLEAEVVVLETGDGTIRIPLSEVEEAHLVYDWDAADGR